MDDGLKQRLVGAFVLLAIAVLFLPSLFQAEKGRRVDTRSQIPLQPELPAKAVYQAPKRVADVQPAPEPSRMYQLIEESEGSTENTDSSNSESEPAKATQKTADTAKKIAAAVEAQAKPKAKTDVPAEPIAQRAGLDERGSPKAWAIQVASFGELEKAQVLKDKLVAKKYKAYVATVKTAKGQRSRVFVGPKLDRAKADQIKRELDKAYKVNSLVVEFKA